MHQIRPLECNNQQLTSDSDTHLHTPSFHPHISHLFKANNCNRCLKKKRQKSKIILYTLDTVGCNLCVVIDVQSYLTVAYIYIKYTQQFQKGKLSCVVLRLGA